MATVRQGSGEFKEVPPSVIERLCAGGQAARGALDLRVDVEAMRAEVLEHVQALLNTRLAEPEGLEGFPECRRSLLAYGVPDLSSYFHGSQQDVQKLLAGIERAIRLFEPRLDPQSLKVERVREAGDTGLQLRLRIHAVLRVHPFRSQVVFDTRIEVDTGAVVVQESEA
ncbi:MAG: type VI secretion system baseplate subunit TssE [Planctomycetes bacterium]|nr:type VI secretion system baseplate subunit TssE [Planctomycetota bacterium]